MQLSTGTKIRVLENFHSLDYVLFGKPVAKVGACCPAIVEDYVSVKGALLSTMIEMYALIEHSPKPLTEAINGVQLRKMARESAKIAREMCQKLVASPKGRANLKQELREEVANIKAEEEEEEKKEEKVDIEEMVKEKIRTKALSLAVDNLIIARAISESKNYSKMNSWEGKIIEDAYKILRDSLVENAILLIDNVE